MAKHQAEKDGNEDLPNKKSKDGGQLDVKKKVNAATFLCPTARKRGFRLL